MCVCLCGYYVHLSESVQTIQKEVSDPLNLWLMVVVNTWMVLRNKVRFCATAVNAQNHRNIFLAPSYTCKI